MIQQEIYEYPILVCNKVDHNEENINAICLRVECKETPSQCQYCTLKLHQKCLKSTMLFRDLPRLILHYEQIISGLCLIKRNDNKLLKKLTAEIE